MAHSAPDANFPDAPNLGLLTAVGLGTDLVYIPSFAAQCQQPGSVFPQVFTRAELRYAHRRCPGDWFASATAQLWAPHLAVRWAAREAFVKAWSFRGQPPFLTDTPSVYADISVASDQWGRPALHLTGKVHAAFLKTCPGLTPLLSLSHDGDYALAVVTLVPTASK